MFRGSSFHTIDNKGRLIIPARFRKFIKSKDGDGVNVIVFHSPCLVFERRVSRGSRRPPLEIDQELCNACSLCVRVLGCPALAVTNGAYVIDAEL